MERRGQCGGRFSPDLPGVQRRVSWCSFNAELIEMPPAISLEQVFGAGIPDSVTGAFRGTPDEYGFIDWTEVTSCPLVEVDAMSPAYRQSWLVDVYESAVAINSKFPAHWHLQDPTPIHLDSVALLRSETESAGMWRTQKKEDW